MLIELSKYNNLGNVNEIGFIITELLSEKFVNIRDIENYCLYNSSYIRIPVQGIISLLNYISLVEIKDNDVTLTQNGIMIRNKLMSGAKLVPLIAKSLINRVLSEDEADCLLDIRKIKYNRIYGKYIIRNSDIPICFSNIRNLLISLGILGLDDFSNNNLLINNSYLKYFVKEAKENRVKRDILELKQKLLKQEEMGEKAELYVIDYELDRLKNHVQRDMISRISELDVTAGYDILSFNSCDSFQIDRFIEVKSFSKILGFYWSKNEIKVSERLRDKYYLYLVDINRINVQKYEPIIIKNPFDNVFNDVFWNKDPQNWFIEPNAEKEILFISNNNLNFALE